MAAKTIADKIIGQIFGYQNSTAPLNSSNITLYYPTIYVKYVGA